MRVHFEHSNIPLSCTAVFSVGMVVVLRGIETSLTPTLKNNQISVAHNLDGHKHPPVIPKHTKKSFDVITLVIKHD